MRVSGVVLLASFLLQHTNADRIDDLAAQLPSCAQSCIEDSARSAGCSGTDWTCLCTKMPASATADACVLKACSTDGYMLALTVITQVCVEVLTDSIGGGSDFDFTIPTFTIPGVGVIPTSASDSPSGDDSSNDSSDDSGSGSDTGDIGGSSGRSGSGSGGSSSGSKSGLSTGAIVGIAVGVCVGTLLVASAAFALFWRRRKRAAASQAATITPAAPMFPPPAGAPQKAFSQHTASTMYNPNSVSPMTQAAVFGSVSPSTQSQTTYYTTPTQTTPSPGPQGAYMAGGGGHPSELGAHPANIPEMGTYNPQPSELASVPVMAEAGGTPVQPVTGHGAPP